MTRFGDHPGRRRLAELFNVFCPKGKIVFLNAFPGQMFNLQKKCTQKVFGHGCGKSASFDASRAIGRNVVSPLHEPQD